MTRAQLLLPLGLLIAVIVSALAVVATKHENRDRVAELDQMRRDRERLEAEWAQLQLEEATLGHPARIERLAREQLKMVEPKQYVIVPLEPVR